MRFPDLFADRIWSRIGAERDAEIIVDAAGFAGRRGRDLHDAARPRALRADAPPGRRDRRPPRRARGLDRRVCSTRDDELIAAFDDDSLPGRPDAFYHDAWWVWDGAAGIYSGYGINGQQLLSTTRRAP